MCTYKYTLYILYIYIHIYVCIYVVVLHLCMQVDSYIHICLHFVIWI